MKVWCIQQIFPACIHPLFLWKILAHGTTSVPAGIIMDGNAATVLTDTYIGTKCTSLAVHDVISCFPLRCRQFMSFPIARIKVIKHILYSVVFAHGSPPFGASKGLRMPRSVLLLTWR